MTLAAKPLLVEEGEWLAHQGRVGSLLAYDRAHHVTSRGTVSLAGANDRSHQSSRRPNRKTNLQPRCLPDHVG